MFWTILLYTRYVCIGLYIFVFYSAFFSLIFFWLKDDISLKQLFAQYRPKYLDT